jgi:hypothetical protein
MDCLSNIDPQGGMEGGTHLKIQGDSFDGYNDATEVRYQSSEQLNTHVASRCN